MDDHVLLQPSLNSKILIGRNNRTSQNVRKYFLFTTFKLLKILIILGHFGRLHSA